MNWTLVLSILIVSALTLYPANGDEEEAEFTMMDYVKKIRTKIFTDYDPKARPVANLSEPLNVSISLGLLSFNKLLYNDKSLSVIGWVRLSWEDPFLRWDPAQFGDIETIRVEKDEVYRPDITNVGSMSTSNGLNSQSSHSDLILKHTGEVAWIPVTSLATKCEVNLANWPFDEFNCSVEFTSWTHHGWQVDLHVDNGPVLTHEFNFHPKWIINGGRCERKVIIYDCCPETYISIECYIEVKHGLRSVRYLVNWPITCAIALALMSLWLDLRSPTRSHLQTMAFVTLLLEALFLAVYLSRESYQLPQILKYLGIMITLSLLLLFWTAFAVNLISSRIGWFMELVFQLLKPLEPLFNHQSEEHKQTLLVIKVIDVALFVLFATLAVVI